MSIIRNITIVIILLIIVSVRSIAQDKRIDKIEMFYDQGNYHRVYKKVQKLQRKYPVYKESAPLILFQSLSEFQLAQTKKRFKELKAIEKYRNFLKLDSVGEYRVMYADYIYDMQVGIVEKIREYQKSGKTDKAEEWFLTYNNLFGAEPVLIQKEETEHKEEGTLQTDEQDNVISEEQETDSKTIKKQRHKIIKEAEKYIGKPYRYGGTTPKGFDCSGFTQYVYSKNGVKLPRTSQAQANISKHKKLKEAEVGDLVFFGKSKNKINHVGIINKIEGDKVYMIHASTSRGIMETEITTNVYWSKRVLFVTKVQ